MARSTKHAPVNLSQRVNFSASVIERLSCPANKQQVFLRDSEAPALRVRCTSNGAKSFVFEAKLNRQTIRRTIGDVKSWSIDQARVEARRLSVLLDGGTDPRDQERLLQAEQAEKIKTQKVQAVAVGQVWVEYIAERRSHWSERHYQDHLSLSKPGGDLPKNRRQGKTLAGPLYHFMPMALISLKPDTVESWAQHEGLTRPTVARLAWRCLKAFLNWCAEHPDYRALVGTVNSAKSKRAREALGRPKVKHDALMKEQLPAWFGAVSRLSNPTVAAYFVTLLLTGARSGEILVLRWEDVNWTWRSLRIRDKVDGERDIPLTPYVAHLLNALPRRNQWVFASPRTDRANQHMTRLDPMHASVCRIAGIEGLTLHGLRRSFASLTEWLEIPAGVVAQIQGHKPSATAEKHYKRRPLDLLRLHHERIEAWALEQAGIEFAPSLEAGNLRVVA